MATEIRERTSELITGQSHRMSLGPESLPVTAVLRNPRKTVLVLGAHLEDVILVEPFINSMKEKYPDSFMAVVVHENLSSLVEEIDLVDRVVTTDLSGKQAKSGKLTGICRELSEGTFDVAVAISHEAETAVGFITSRSGAKLRIGFESMVRKGMSLNVLFRDSGETEVFSKRLENLFSLLGVKRPGHFESNLVWTVRDTRNALDFLRERQGERFIGFFFDQTDPLDRLKKGSAGEVIRTVVNRRSEKCIAAGFGLSERDLKDFSGSGVRTLADRTLVELTGAYFDCSWTVTNSLGFSALMGMSGSRVIYIGDPSRLRKFPLNGIRSVNFLSTSFGDRFHDSLVRVMEEKYPGE
jgi:hypothetical protein